MVERDEGIPGERVFQIEGVPLITQRHGNWCGYASLAMVLQYWGHLDMAPERLFEHIQGKPYDESAEAEYKTRSLAPTTRTLALTARELTSLTTRVLGERDLKKVNRNPHEFLEACIVKKVPVIVREPGHFTVVTGMDIAKGGYIFNDPTPLSFVSRLGGIRFKSFDAFEADWKRRSTSHPGDTRHLMLVIRPPRQRGMHST